MSVYVYVYSRARRNKYVSLSESGIYQDQMSGKTASRPGLNQLMADARLRKFDAVLVWKLDRFGRSLVHCVGAIQELQALGIRFIAISQGLDTDQSNPTSQLLMHILAAVAQFERELIHERVSSGMRAAKTHGTKTGNAIGRPRRFFDRQEVLRLRATGLLIEGVARQMSIGVGTVVRVLKAVGGRAGITLNVACPEVLTPDRLGPRHMSTN